MAIGSCFFYVFWLTEMAQTGSPFQPCYFEQAFNLARICLLRFIALTITSIRQAQFFLSFAMALA